MKIRIYGDRDKEKILALHPMLINGEIMAELIQGLKKDYCIIAPDFTAHGADHGEFESAVKETKMLAGYLKKKGWTEFRMIFGASLGAAVGMRLLALPEIKAQAVVFEGCILHKNASLLLPIAMKTFYGKFKQMREDPVLCEKNIKKIYGETFGGGMAESFRNMSEKSIRAIITACAKCEFPKYSKELQSRMFFEYGSEDFNREAGEKNIGKHYPHAHISVRPGFAHCQYMAKMGTEYGDVLQEYLEATKDFEL